MSEPRERKSGPEEASATTSGVALNPRLAMFTSEQILDEILRRAHKFQRRAIDLLAFYRECTPVMGDLSRVKTSSIGAISGSEPHRPTTQRGRGSTTQVRQENEASPERTPIAERIRAAQLAYETIAARIDLLQREHQLEIPTGDGVSKTRSSRNRNEQRQRSRRLLKLRARFRALAVSADPQRRGYAFQSWLYDLFHTHELDPHGSFAGRGEQIDGSICLDGQLLLVEARWGKDPVGPSAVRDFVGKFEQKLDNTLGLMISVHGFTPDAKVRATSAGRLLTIFMDGVDLKCVLEGFVDLRQLLSRKLRYAAEKGDPMYRMVEGG